MADFKRVLGIADYHAHWVQRSNVVCLTASGILPCFNYTANLEQRPERVTPPMWDMVFFVQDFCQTAIRPFSIEQRMVAPLGTTHINVRDAVGDHRIELVSTSDGTLADMLSSIVPAYRVYARLPKTDDGPHGCIVVPAGSIVLAIYYPVFGPAPKEECDAFVTRTCKAAAPSAMRGDDNPYPLA